MWVTVLDVARPAMSHARRGGRSGHRSVPCRLAGAGDPGGGPVTVEATSTMASLIGSWRTEGEVFGEDGRTVVAEVRGSDVYEA